MGEFTQNLLKLTEFPFSYSLIGLLALIAGKGINPEEISFDKLGPLLILMGFVSTTLSICDPLGALQRHLVKGGYAYRRRYRGKLLRVKVEPTNALRILRGNIFGIQIWNFFQLPYIFAIRYKPESINKSLKINWDSMKQNFESGGGLVTMDW